MDVSDPTLARIAATLHDEYGDALRVVAAFDRRDYRIEHFREDVREEVGEETAYEILDEAQLSSLGHPGYEDLYGGALEGVVRIFGHTVVVTIPVAETAGVVVSFDREADFRGRRVITTVEGVIDSATHASD